MLSSQKRIELLKELSLKTDSRIMLVVMDGLGGLPGKNGLTELEAAKKPNLDKLVKEGKTSLGLIDPISPGFTPGSGPAHMSLFGYDPVETWIGRGLLSALGIGFHLEPNDVASRANFCTIDPNGTVTDRRAGRIATELNAELCKRLDGTEIDGIKVFVKPEMEHRAVVIFRGEGLSEKLGDTDPQMTGKKPLDPAILEPGNKTAQKTAAVIKKFLALVKEKLSDQKAANFMLLRGFAEMLKLPSMNEIYKLTCGAVAAYPMYKGLSKLVGMTVVDVPGLDVTDEIKALKANYSKFDFIFFHYKKTDSAGEDGDFDKKVAMVEKFDHILPEILNLNPDVLIITGDHSTPWAFAAHSFHPVPFLLSAKSIRPDKLSGFGETECVKGSLGRFPALDTMPLAMAYAGKLEKYGA